MLAPVETRYARSAMVSCSDHVATGAGVAMLRAGGSAADAALAASAVLAVTWPQHCGPGGDLFALVHVPGEDEPAVLNASGRAGSGADPARLREAGETEMPSRGDVRSVTVPGCVDGWVALHERYGRLALADVLEPAQAARGRRVRGEPAARGRRRRAAGRARAARGRGPPGHRRAPPGHRARPRGGRPRRARRLLRRRVRRGPARARRRRVRRRRPRAPWRGLGPRARPARLGPPVLDRAAQLAGLPDARERLDRGGARALRAGRRALGARADRGCRRGPQRPRPAAPRRRRRARAAGSAAARRAAGADRSRARLRPGPPARRRRHGRHRRRRPGRDRRRADAVELRRSGGAGCSPRGSRCTTAAPRSRWPRARSPSTAPAGARRTRSRRCSCAAPTARCTPCSRRWAGRRSRRSCCSCSRAG